MGKSLFDDLISADKPVNVFEQEEETTDQEETVDESTDAIDESENTDGEDHNEESIEIDDRVKALYDILVDSNIIGDIDDFKPTVDNFQNLVDQLPEHFFMRAVSGLPEHLQVLLEYGLNNPESSPEDLNEFFVNYLAPSEIQEPETDDEAIDFLKPILLQNKLFTSESKVDKYLEDLLEEGTLLDKAIEVYNEYESNRNAEMQEQLEQVKIARQQEQQQQQEYYEQLYDTVDSLDWDKDRKSIVLNNLMPNEVQRKNQLIMQSPKAVVQLADIYSYFNEEKGEFEFDNFGIRKVSNKLQSQKDKIQKDKISSHLSNIKTGQRGTSDGSFWSSFKPSK